MITWGKHLQGGNQVFKKKIHSEWLILYYYVYIIICSL